MKRLFRDYNLSEVIQQKERQMMGEIDSYDRNEILNVSLDDLCDYFENRYLMWPIILHKDKIYIKNHGDVNIDVSCDTNRMIFDRSKPFYIKGTSITFAIPFDGDHKLFYCRASTFGLSPPRAQISDSEIFITYNSVNPNSEKIKCDFERELAKIEEYIGFCTSNVTTFNSSLREKAKQKIELRRKKLLNDSGVVAALGYPIKQTSNIPNTYKVPEIKRKVIIKRPCATTTSFVPEPVLDMEIYEGILEIISNMVIVMERSPNDFKNMKEETLRQHFLVQLNGHFEGEATGETFNYTGKTDILIRSKNKNIFIAECTFWKGTKSLLEKVNQLLRYVSWRDTKTAILIFNKNKELTNVLAQISKTIKKHNNYKRQLDYTSETGFRFILHHNTDKNRELILTILVFDVPQ